MSTSLRELLEATNAQDLARTLWGEPDREIRERLFYKHKGGERHASLSVTVNGFVNFGDGGGEKGGKLALIEYALDCDREAAKTWLREYHGGTPQIAPHPAPTTPKKDYASPPDQRWQDQARQIIAAGVAALCSPKGAAALDYLHGRGLTDETIHLAQLGYDSTKHRIIIPAIIGGAVWYVKFRNLSQRSIKNGYKYTHLEGGNGSGAVYNADAIRADLPIVKVEGEFDAMSGHQVAGHMATFVTVGSASTAIAPHFLRLFEGQTVISIPDNDDKKLHRDLPQKQWGKPAAGMAHAINTDDQLQGIASLHKVALLPNGVKDLTDYLTGGATDHDLVTLLNTGSVNFADFYQPLTARSCVSYGELARPNTTTLPDSMRAGLIAHTNIGPVLELGYEALAARLIEPNATLTQSDMQSLSDKLGRGLTESQIQRAFKADIWQRVDFPAYCPQSSVLNNFSSCTDPSYSGQSEDKSATAEKQAHRPAARYYLPSLETIRDYLKKRAWLGLIEKHIPHLEDDLTIAPIRYFSSDDPALAAELDSRYGKLITAQPKLQAKLDRALIEYKRLVHSLENPHSTSLPTGWIYGNTSDYRACLARALIVAAGGETQLGRPALARQLGTSQRRIKAVLKRAGIRDVGNQFEEKPIANAADLPRELTRWHTVYLENVDGTMGSRAYTDDRASVERFITQSQAAGRVVKLRTQIANKQVIEVPEQPQPAPRLKVVKLPTKALRLAVPTTTAQMALFGGLPWRERGLLLLLKMVTQWCWHNGQLLDNNSGELRTYSVAEVRALLLEHLWNEHNFSVEFERQTI